MSKDRQWRRVYQHPIYRFCAANGIKRELTTPYNPASNGVAERYNRTLCEPNAFCGEALQTAVHIINRSPHNSLKDGIPEDIWSSKSASFDRLHIFGCEAFMHVRQELRNKLDAKSINASFWDLVQMVRWVTEFGYLVFERKPEVMMLYSMKQSCSKAILPH